MFFWIPVYWESTDCSRPLELEQIPWDTRSVFWASGIPLPVEGRQCRYQVEIQNEKRSFSLLVRVSRHFNDKNVGLHFQRASKEQGLLKLRPSWCMSAEPRAQRSTLNSNPPSTMSATVFPVSLYEDILPKLVAVLELTQDPAGVSNLQARQKLLQAVCPPNLFEVYWLKLFCSFFRQTTSKMRSRRRRNSRPTSLVESCLLKSKMILFRCWKLWEIVNGTRPFFLLFFNEFTLVFRAQLAQFAARKVTSTAAAHNFKMEVDSVASTPYGSDDWTFGFLLVSLLNISNIITTSTSFPCTSVWPFCH